MKTEEKRKLQELGGSLYLSLPSSWLSKFNVKKGNEIIISLEESGELRIFPEAIKAPEEKTSIIVYDKYLFRNLIRDYLFGSDIIKIKKTIPFTGVERKEISSHVSNLLNLEIIEEGSNSISIQNLKSDIPIKKMIARMYFLTKSMMEDLIKDHKDKEILQSITERDKLVGKFYLAIIMQQRALLTRKWSKELSLVEILDLRLLIQKIEQMGDEIKKLVMALLNHDKMKLNIEDIKFLLEKYESAYTAYIKQDTETAKKFWDTEKADKKRLSYNEDLVRIYDNIKDISDLVI
jgi:phosphate uptake regulator